MLPCRASFYTIANEVDSMPSPTVAVPKAQRPTNQEKLPPMAANPLTINPCRTAPDPLVSVVIVAYNSVAFLPAAVYSVLGQEGVTLELIIVDNASTDGTRNFLATLQDPRLRVITNSTNEGPQAANLALPYARGRYIARLDADDIALPLRLARQTAFLESHPELGGCGSAYETLKDGAAGEIIRADGEAEVVTWALGWENCIGHSTLLFRRELIGTVGGYDRELWCAQDYDLISRLTRARPLAILDEVLVLYRVHAQSVTHSRRRQMQEESRATARAHLDYTLNQEIPAAVADAAIAMMRLERPCAPEHCRAALKLIADYTNACCKDLSPPCAHLIRERTCKQLLQFARSGLPAGDVTRWDVEKLMLGIHPRSALGRIRMRGRASAPLLATAAVTIVAVRNLGAILGWTPTAQTTAALLWVGAVTLLAMSSDRILARLPRLAKAI
jgi:hypothetical protein